MFSRVWHQVLPVGAFETFARKIVHLAPSVPGGRERCSYWYELGAAPRSSVELLLHHFAAMVRAEIEMPAVCGIEWWINARPSSAGLQWHFDRDEQYYSESGLVRHPDYASVFYLGDSGGATIVTDRVLEDGLLRGDLVSDGLLVPPQTNALFLFRGCYRHAVLRDPDASETRITLAVNWWSSPPGAPFCRAPKLADLATAGEFVRLDAPWRSPDVARPLDAATWGRACALVPSSGLEEQESLPRARGLL